MRSRGRAWLTALAVGGVLAACDSPRDDRFVLLRRGPHQGEGPTALAYPTAADAGAARVRRLMSDGFSGELLRTFSLARRLALATAPSGSARHARAEAPPYLALGVSDLYHLVPYRDRVIGTGWWRQRIPADAPMVWIDDEPDHGELGQRLMTRVPTSNAAGARVADGGSEAVRDAVALEQITGGFARAILSLVAAPPSPPPSALDPPAIDPLTEGYVLFLEVVGAEWRSTGETADVARAARRARERLQRADWFAAVRANAHGEAALRPALDRGSRPDAEALVRDPILIATFLHRLAASPAGRRLAADDVYRPLVDDVPPAGISPGRLLGAFRGFQAKLLVAWSHARLAGQAPRDLIDLVDAYAAAYPEERPEVTRIFLVTTYGVTARPGGVDPALPAGEVEARLAALTADVLFGRSDLRSALARHPAPGRSAIAAPAEGPVRAL